MGRIAKISLWVVAGLAGLVALLVLVVALFDWNALRPWVSEKASDALQRPVAIEGDLGVDWQWRSGWLPWPHVTARNIVAGQPVGFSGGDEAMGGTEYFGVSINPIHLFGRHVTI